MASIEIFTGPNCNYCRMAKELLDRHELQYVELDVSTPDNLRLFAERLPRKKSLPQIFLAGEYIGGYEDLMLLGERGILADIKKGE